MLYDPKKDAHGRSSSTVLPKVLAKPGDAVFSTSLGFPAASSRSLFCPNLTTVEHDQIDEFAQE